MKCRFPLCWILLLLGGCHDDTPNRMKVIDAAAVAHTVYALTPAGAREAERRRQTHAIDEFQLRCEAG